MSRAGKLLAVVQADAVGKAVVSFASEGLGEVKIELQTEQEV